jgi:MobA/VirD2-like, nuclease domain
MIAKGNPHGDGAKLASYLVTGGHGETAELAVMRGFAAGDLAAAFRQEQLRVRGTKAAAGFFHCYIRLAPGERLTRRQWLDAGERAEHTLGFTGQPCAMSFHTDRATGERHLHIAWSRIACREDGRLHALDPGLYKLKLKELARALEREHGLRIVGSDRAPDAKTRAADRNEFEEARRLGIGLKQIRNAIHDCLHRADNGAAFKAALDAAGLVLAQGDKRDCFVVVDQAGGHHALNKKLTGLTLAQIRTRLGDLDRARLPDVAQAKTRQRARQPARDFSRASRIATETAQEAPETPKHRRAANVPTSAPTASTARENARAPPIDGQGLSPLFRRLARVLANRIEQVATAPRRRAGISITRSAACAMRD